MPFSVADPRGTRNAFPPGLISFISVQFSAKFLPNNRLAHTPLGNPVSATTLCY